jgi:hypothetical protein
MLNEGAIAAKVAELESSQRNYSDIDLIYEKKAAQNQPRQVRRTDGESHEDE